MECEVRVFNVLLLLSVLFSYIDASTLDALVSKDKQVKKLYEKLGNTHLWYTGDVLGDEVQKTLDILREDTYYGACDEAFVLPSSTDIDANDVAISRYYLRYMKHLAYGCIDWKKADKKLKKITRSRRIKGAAWERYPYKGDLVALSVKHKSDFSQAIKAVTPNYYGYMTLVKEAKRLESLGNIKHPKVHITKSLHVGDNSEEVSALAQTLHAYGYLQDVNVSDVNYTSAISDAVKVFQKKSGIKVDGIAGRQTATYLNTPNKKTLRRIRLNIERYKVLSRENKNHYFSVNIPDFTLSVIQEDKVTVTSGVVVGKKSKQTPIFREKLRYCVLNPKWFIPQSIVKKSIIPHMLKDAGYLKRRHIVVYDGFSQNANLIADPYSLDLEPFVHNKSNVPYRFVQLANKASGLGKVKFIFPNKYSVYLHDTIGKWRYKTKRIGLRAVSSGCLRLETPMTLLEHVTKTATKKSFKHVKTMIRNKKSGSVSLSNTVYVNIVYLTAFVDSHNKVRFAPDIYGYDRIQTLTY